MWSGAAAILVLSTVSASGARAQSSLPDVPTTPGAINPTVTQKTIAETICVRGWTQMVRPPVGYTEELKRQQIAAFGYHDRRLSHYEEDRLLSRWGWAAPRPIRGTSGPSRGLRPTVGGRTGRMS
jgi:hypothetical protein